MRLGQIRIRNVRNIRDALVDPGPNLNIVLGTNGSGKSSLLESIHLLGRAGSFRTKHISEIINHEAKELVISGDIKQKTDLTHRIGINLGNRKRTIRIDGTEVHSRMELLECFPLLFISPLSYLLIEGPPNMRRQFVDWGVFHLEQQYPDEWKRFKRCLTQRNSTLKVGNVSSKGVWDAEFVKYGTIITRRRKEYLDQLLPYLEEIVEELLPSIHVVFEYFEGWNLNQELHEVLTEEYRKDLQFGYTHSGPHKSDLVLKVNDRSCKSFLSRGQTKLLVLAMKLAQIKLLIDKRNKFTSLLIDDFCAELDRGNSKKLKQFLSDMDLQCFITAMDRDSVGTLCGINSTLFHVEHGHIDAI